METGLAPIVAATPNLALCSSNVLIGGQMHFLKGTDPGDREKGRRHSAVLTVRSWLTGRSHLPRDLVAALHRLIPELARDGKADGPPPGDDA